MFKKNASLLFLCFLVIYTQAQNNYPNNQQGKNFKEPCGTMSVLQNQKNNNPAIEQNMQAIDRHTKQILDKKNHTSNKVKEVITIPVVFHVVYKTEAENLSEERLRSQIDVLNEDFNMKNANADETLDIFKDRAANMEIEFCLAQRDPDGLPTSGIEYISTSIDTFSVSGPQAVKFSELGGADAWSSDEYLNIWVCDLSPGLLGYAAFPGMEKITDGVVLDYVHVGRIGTSPNIIGRTATHEVGHWLNLRHIWGDDCSEPDNLQTCTCEGSDGIDDTNNAKGPHYGCQTQTQSCGSPDMVQNYMDYSSDQCLTFFSKGQKEVARAIFEPDGAREILLSSQACTPPVLKDDDARLVQLTNVKNNENFCNTSFTPAIQFRNFGNNTLSRLKIETYLNNDLVNSFNWTGNVATGEFAETNLNTIELPKGGQELKIVIADVNTLPNEEAENNTVTLNIQALGNSVPFEENFEENNFPPIYTNLIDKDNDDEGFELKKGVAYTGENCMFINCFDYGLSGAIDEFVLPLIDFSNTGNPMLSFYNAYARYDSSDSDTLEILVSKNCGENYTSVYKIEGFAMATVGFRQEYFEPSSSSQWLQRMVNLKAYEGESEVSIKFRCINSHEQNLYIDDIRIFGDSILPITAHLIDNSIIQLHPNPVYDELNIQWDSLDSYQLQLRSVNGQIIFNEDNESRKINLQHLVPGIYILEIQSGESRFSKKIIKL